MKHRFRRPLVNIFLFFGVLILTGSTYLLSRQRIDITTLDCTDILAGAPAESNFCTVLHQKQVVWHPANLPPVFTYRLNSAPAYGQSYGDETTVNLKPVAVKWLVTGEKAKGFSSNFIGLVRIFSSVPSWLPGLQPFHCSHISDLFLPYSSQQAYFPMDGDQLMHDWKVQKEGPNLPIGTPPSTTMSAGMVSLMETGPIMSRGFDPFQYGAEVEPRVYEKDVTVYYYADTVDRNGQRKHLVGSWTSNDGFVCQGYWDISPQPPYYGVPQCFP